MQIRKYGRQTNHNKNQNLTLIANLVVEIISLKINEKKGVEMADKYQQTACGSMKRKRSRRRSGDELQYTQRQAVSRNDEAAEENENIQSNKTNV